MAQWTIGVPYTLSATANLPLVNANEWAVGRWIVHVTIGGSATVKPQKRVTVTSGTAPTYADCWYTLALTNAEIAAGTTQTSTCILDIDASGCDVQLVTTIATSTIILVAWPLVG